MANILRELKAGKMRHVVGENYVLEVLFHVHKFMKNGHILCGGKYWVVYGRHIKITPSTIKNDVVDPCSSCFGFIHCEGFRQASHMFPTISMFGGFK